MDGVDLSRYRVGSILELPDADAKSLIAEGCAELVPEPREAPDQREED